MIEREINLDELKNYLLSPGNIFWIKNNGSRVLISKKGDVGNLSLIEKIISKKEKVVINDEVDKVMLHESREIYKIFTDVIIYKEKVVWKNRIIEFLKRNFVNGDCSQFELNLICWTWFSSLSEDEAINMINMDKDYFVRSMSMAGIHTLILLMTGYYDCKYLAREYSEMIKLGNELLKSESILSSIEKLEEIRDGKLDLNFLDKIENKSACILFELKNGNGLNKFVESELTLNELNLIELNRNFSFKEQENENVLKRISQGSFTIEGNTKKMIMHELSKSNSELAA